MASICLDVGTSLIKAVAFDEDGNELSVVRQPTEVLRPQPGLAEQDMGAVWEAVIGAVKEMTGSLDEQVELLAFTGQGDGCWLVDADGRPTGPAVLWNDARNAALVQKWERDGTLARAFEINGSLAFPGLPCAVLPWLREHEPERVENAYRSMFCDGWIFLRLTGEFGIDESDASVPLLDIRSGEYSDELLAMYELEWARELLPDIRRQGSRIGELCAEAAEAMGLAPGLPVVMAPFDIAATSIGCGSVDTGQACSILGTTLCTEIVADEVDTGDSAAGFTISRGVPNRYLRAFLDPGARGTAFGLTVEHGRADIARAVFEGLTLVVRDCLAAASTESTELRLCGGGSASDFWCQLIADATGLVTRRSADSELGAKGALITALVETGGESDFTEAASRLAKMGDEFSPDDRAREAMSERYERFLEMREVAERSWRVLEGGGPES